MLRALALGGHCDDHARQQGSKIEAAIETILGLAKVAVSVLLEVERMVDSVDGVLQVSQDGVNPGKAFPVRALPAFADNFTLLVHPA